MKPWDYAVDQLQGTCPYDDTKEKWRCRGCRETIVRYAMIDAARNPEIALKTCLDEDAKDRKFRRHWIEAGEEQARR